MAPVNKVKVDRILTPPDLTSRLHASWLTCMFFDKLSHGGKKHPLNSKSKRARHSVKVEMPSKVVKSEIHKQHTKRRSMPRIVESRRRESSDEDDNWQANIQRLSRKVSPAVDASNNVLKPRRLFNRESLQIGVDDLLLTNTCAKTVARDRKSYREIFPSNPSQTIELFLPFGYEQVTLVDPKNKDDVNIAPMVEMVNTLRIIAEYFLPPDLGVVINDPHVRDCVLRQVSSALQSRNLPQLLTAIQVYNDLIRKARTDGTIQHIVENSLSCHTPLDFELVNEILTQVYSRTVSMHVGDLRRYKAFSSNVYGELLPRFVSSIFKDTYLTQDQIFIDLGSGVGNCVLQAAVEIGCHSVGCEIMPRAAELAIQQQNELDARMRAYGLESGEIRLEQGDFLENSLIQTLLPQVDVLLVNNYAFSAELNESLLHMFLDLKDGAKVVSLRSFVPQGYVISERNRESPLSILDVEEKLIPQNSVSWTDASGKYYISTINRLRIGDN